MNSTFEIQDENISSSFVKAVFFHFFLVAVVWTLGQDFFKQNSIEKQKEIEERNLKLLKSSVRVDVVGMPKFTLMELKEMKNLAPAQAAQEEILEESKANSVQEDENTFKEQSKKVDLSSLLKGISSKKANEKIVKKAPQKARSGTNSKLANIAGRNLKNLILEGNKVSSGKAIEGDLLSGEQTVFEQYVTSLPDHVRRHWKLPSYLLNGNLNCKVRVFISSTGKILNLKIYQSSGTSEFDNKALSAIRKSDPFPNPATSILSRVTSGEVILGFPL